MRIIWREIIPLCLLISSYLPNIFIDLEYDSYSTHGSLDSLLWYFTSKLRGQLFVHERTLDFCSLSIKLKYA